MKCLLVISICITLSAAEYVIKSQENLLEYRKECVSKLSVPDELVEKFKKWEYPNDKLTQCYLKCVFIRFGLFDMQSGFNVENIHRQLAGADAELDHKDELHGKIEACIDKNEQGSDACEWAYRGAICLFKNHLPLVQQSLLPKAVA